MTELAAAPVAAPDPLSTLWTELGALIEPLRAAAGGPEARADLATRLGWDLGALGSRFGIDDLSTIDQQITTWIAAVQSAVDTLRQLVAGGVPNSLEDLRARAKLAGDAASALRGLPQPWQGPGVPPAVLAHMGGDLVDHLTDTYLARHAPVLRRVLALLGVLEPGDAGAPDVAEPIDAAAPVRLPMMRPRWHPEQLGALLRDPLAALRTAYGWTSGGPNDLDALSDLLFPRLVALLTELGLDAGYGLGGGPSPSGEVLTLAGRMLLVRGAVGPESARVNWGLNLAFSPPAVGGLGLVVVPAGELKLNTALDDWNLSATLGGGGVAFSVNSAGVAVDGGAADIGLTVQADRRRPADGPAVLLGPAGGTRLELATLSLRAFATLGATGNHDYGLSADAGSTTLVITGGDTDGFLGSILPKGGLRVALPTSLGWSRRGGLSLSGGVGVHTTLPVHRTLGPLTVDGITLDLSATAADRGLRATASTGIGFALGPVRGTVEEIGLRGELTFPEGGGNLGVADARLSLAPPKGIALRVESDVVTGAGYLAMDPENGRYAGAVDLQFAKLRLSALGLLTTRLPDGKPGFSLLVLVNARFPEPVPLGFGFNLAGVGGLLGINRAVHVDRVREGLRSGALTALLAPGDAVGRDPGLLAGLEGMFPATPGRFVFGPTARITWGTPTVVTADLGLALELPAPVRLLAAGQVRVLLPDERAPIVVLNLDALGVLDFGAGTLAIDAVLHDSKIGDWPVSGDMALRAQWSGAGEFVLSVGGFHPRFTPPPGFPALRRMALSIGGDVVRADLSAYLALTANTLQLGARAVLAAKVGNVSADGAFTFDALVQFSPFGFEIDLTAMVAVRWKDTLLLGVQADLYLRGPGRWYVRGTAKVTVLMITATVHFEGSFGEEAELPPAPAQDVAALVRGELAEPGAWSLEPAPSVPAAITLRPGATAAGTLVAPGARIRVRQRVAPLGGITMDRFGQSPITGDHALSIDSATLGGADAEFRTLRDPFSAGQFRDLSDEEKLSHASFEPMPSGAEFTATTAISFDTGGPDPVDIGYRTVLIDAPDTPPTAFAGTTAALAAAPPPPGPVPPPLPGPVPVPPPSPDWMLSGALLERVAPTGAAGRAATRGTGAARFAGVPALPLATEPAGFVLAWANGLELASPSPAPGEHWTWAEANDMLRRFRIPGQPKIVVRETELAGSGGSQQ